ncbi:hypothetical protein ANANG_G00313950 [Anguilla anguilla]|uniref:CBM21 domain-containing protein n=1 Tax=Anguilla anguilla TaxID=7936 RepID=A0A9D3LJT9_ANGAN|nr:hypothetical protein ANANG_G00313950 [Anguilla anguilla]
MEPAGEGRHGGAREEEEEGEEERERGGAASDSEPEPETPASRARRVSFADAFGLDLVSVKEFSSRAFSVPASAAELLAKLQAQRCELECVELLPGTTTLRGTVRVLNLSYDKRVRVRTTLDGWGTHFDLPASFIPGSSDGETDRFAFSLELSPRPAGRDGKGRQCEDTSFRSKRSCLKYNSKEKSTEANTPVISAEATDVPLSKQEVEVSKKTEEPAPNPDGLQDDSCQKPSVESGRNPSRRSRRRAARRARLQERSHRAAAAGREGSPAQDNRDTDGQADADAGRSPSEVSALPHEGACMMWDWSQRRRAKARDEFPPQAGTEGPLPPLRFAADAGAALAGPGEDTHSLSGLPTDTFGSVEDGRANVASGPESRGSPQTGEGDASTQTQAAADISASVRDSLDDDITGGKDGDRRHSHPLSGDGGGTDALQDSDLLWPQSDRGGGKFKFETFVAPLYHQAFHGTRPDSRDVSRGLWAGGPASDDSDDEGQVGSADSCSRLTVMATARPLFPFGTYAPPVHPLGRSGEILESAPDKSLSTDTRVPKQEQLVYGQEDAAQPLLETSGAGAEITAHSRVHRAAEERKDERHGRENEREDLDEEVGVVFRGLGLDPCKDLKAEALGDEDVHLHTDRAAAGGETEGDVEEAGEVFKEEGKRSVDGEDPDREAEEDNVSTDSLTDDEMELHMRSVKSAIGPPLGRAAESPNEDGDAAEEPGLPPAETAGDGGAAAAPPAEAVENAAGTYLSSWADAFWASHLGRTFLYVLLCALFFFTAYHYDFLACFALYLFSVFWLCFHGDKQRLQEANRGK